METKYRLKEQARPFVKENLWNKSLTKKQWTGFHISEWALEQTPTITVEVGIRTEFPPKQGEVYVSSATQIGKWSIDFGGKVFFTVNFLNAPFRIFQEFEKGKHTKKLCQALEQKANEIVAEITDLKIPTK